MEGRSLFVTDVDNTVLGDDAALARFADWFSQIRDRVKLAYNSGRFVASVLESVASTGLPQPDAIIGGVGTEIGFAEDDFRRRPWAPHDDDWDGARVRDALRAFDDLELQPEHLLSPLKVSYYAYDADVALLQRLRQQLTSAGLNVQLIYSSERDLDILPASAGKGAAAGRLAEHWGYAPRKLSSAAIRAMIWPCSGMASTALSSPTPTKSCAALSGDDIYHATAPFAAGVLEGLKHWLEP